MEKIRTLFQSTIIKFIIVGVINTTVGIGSMFICFFILRHGQWFSNTINYWISSATNTITGSIVSYFLNKFFTFQSKESYNDVFKFIVNIIICNVLAYGIAKPLAVSLVSFASTSIKSVVALLFGSVLFTIINYFGQRFWVFKK